MAKKKTGTRREIGNYLIPFWIEEGKKDEMMQYDWRDKDDPRVEYRDNYKFHDILYIESMERGRSSAIFKLISVATDEKYFMFMKDALEMMQEGVVDNGKIDGIWTFSKRGGNYGIRLLTED